MEGKQYLNTDYIIYEDGRCFSNKSNKFLIPKMSVKYPTYNLTIKGKKKSIKVHRMVAETFIPNPENLPVVNHKDGNTYNYQVNNLEWCSYSDNSRHAFQIGLSCNNNQKAIFYKDDYENELWQPIIDYDNYLISNYGRIINKNTKRLKKTPLDNNGYPHTSLWKENKSKTLQVHQLVYYSFHPNETKEGYVINHIDGNKTNNKLDNLERITYQENNYHAEYISKKHNCGKKVGQFDSNNLIAQYNSIAEATRITNITNISRAIKNNGYAGNYKWKFI